MIDGIKFAVKEANNNLQSTEKIISIHIMCTTNGHGTSGGSNHLDGTAIDISRINNKKMTLTGITNQIIELQKGMDKYNYVRENFGPYFKHKFSKEKSIGNQWDLNFSVSGHKDHIHFSIRK